MNGPGECLISIVVPVYNTEPYLRKCLDSLLAQTMKEIEIIAVDDCSTDGCAQILDKYAAMHANLKVIHQTNQGQGPARNSGVSAATGKYIGFVDSDDYVDKEMYRRLYTLVSGSNADMAVCKARAVDMNGVTGRRLDIWNKYGNAVIGREEFLNNDLLNNECSPVLWDKLIRSDIVKRHPSTALRRGQDFIALVDYMSEVKKIAFTDDVLYYYRHRPGSIMVAPECEETILTDFKTEILAVSKIVSYFGGKPICRLYIERIIAEWTERIKDYPALEYLKEQIAAFAAYK